ncbi:MAG TPA: imidazolonepropionase [Bacillota bacterium]|mgnify:CR=1 FL=1|jgi:imidazolonepropionase|nr:imidazolonepropionase [Clostridiales bacterium UBA9856]HOA43109.1 imidazolonepropionase [Bacillota bacterium]HPZ60080.1 imidazolonepropionase [Bacillota bacterium]HQC82974.1 imidazolonepropionase [Bacillota bacterium]
MSKKILVHASQLVTCSGFAPKRGKEMQELNVIEDGAVLMEDGIIAAVGTTEELLPHAAGAEVIDCSGKAVLPGFVDSHTHLIFTGYRAEEFSWRLSGISYMDIMRRGGGINATTISTREATLEELKREGRKRLSSMLAFGVTTVEGKSGYGLDRDTEIKQLEAMKALNEEQPVDIVNTFMGAHAVPEEFKGRTGDYVDFIIKEVLPEVANRGLAEFCDVFCEEGVFDIEQSRSLLLAAREYGMEIKLHADEIVPLGGAELAAELGAVSADHLLQASDEGISKLAERGVIATLLPATAFSLKEPYAKARKMIDSGCAVALATDFNPGSCFTNSIPLLFALATIYMGMTIEEAVTAMTINGAAALKREKQIGSIDVGKKADLVILEFPGYQFLHYHFGVNIVEKVIKNGELVFDKYRCLS